MGEGGREETMEKEKGITTIITQWKLINSG